MNRYINNERGKFAPREKRKPYDRDMSSQGRQGYFNEKSENRIKTKNKYTSQDSTYNSIKEVRKKESNKRSQCHRNIENSSEYRREVLLWVMSSIQHIELLIGSKRVFGVSLTEYMREVLDRFYSEFTYIKKKIEAYDCDTIELVKEFLKINADFIKAINRIMFQEYLCNTQLFEIVNHFMIEQIYASKSFSALKKSPNYKDEQNVLGPDFYAKEGMGKDKKEVIYNSAYFWNLISTQHCSILENILKYYNKDLSGEMYYRLKFFKKAFLKVNRELFDNNKSSCRFRSIVMKMKQLNIEFLTLLYTFTPLEIGTYLPEETPDAFFEFKEHVVEEQEYILGKIEKLSKIL